MLQALPIDLTDEQRKGQMKKSQIGHVVMFLSKPEVENNRSNRRIARVGAHFSSRCSPLHCVSPAAIARPCCKQLKVHAWKQRRSSWGPSKPAAMHMPSCWLASACAVHRLTPVLPPASGADYEGNPERSLVGFALHICDPSAQLLLPQELVNRWSEQIFGAHRDERETADLHERHAQMQDDLSLEKPAAQMNILSRHAWTILATLTNTSAAGAGEQVERADLWRAPGRARDRRSARAARPDAGGAHRTQGGRGEGRRRRQRQAGELAASERRVLPQCMCLLRSNAAERGSHSCWHVIISATKGFLLPLADILEGLHRPSNGDGGISGIDNLHGSRRHSNMVTRASDTMPQSRKQPAWTI